MKDRLNIIEELRVIAPKIAELKAQQSTAPKGYFDRLQESSKAHVATKSKPAIGMVVYGIAASLAILFFVFLGINANHQDPNIDTAEVIYSPDLEAYILDNIDQFDVELIVNIVAEDAAIPYLEQEDIDNYMQSNYSDFDLDEFF